MKLRHIYASVGWKLVSAPPPASKFGYRIILSLLSLFSILPHYLFFSDEIIRTYRVAKLFYVTVVTHKQNICDALVLT